MKVVMDGLLAEVAKNCREALKETRPNLVNHVKKVYENFTQRKFLQKVAELVTPRN